MQTKTFVAILSVLGLLASCAQMNPHPMDMSQAIQNAKTSADHEALAKHYEDTAKRFQVKAQEQSKGLEQYEGESYHYGKEAEDLKAHSRAMIRSYEQAAEANMNMAAAHRKMAAEAK
jgi:hypothetical protein